MAVRFIIECSKCGSDAFIITEDKEDQFSLTDEIEMNLSTGPENRISIEICCKVCGDKVFANQGDI